MKILRSFLITLTVLLMAAAAYGQQTKVKANVPFDFYAGDKVYPAGEYTLNSMSTNDAVVRIDGNPEVSSAYLASNACANATPSTQTTLVFRRMGANYFLPKVWVAGNSQGREFPLTRTERLLVKNGTKAETITVAANVTK